MAAKRHLSEDKISNRYGTLSRIMIFKVTKQFSLYRRQFFRGDNDFIFGKLRKFVNDLPVISEIKYDLKNVTIHFAYCIIRNVVKVSTILIKIRTVFLSTFL